MTIPAGEVSYSQWTGNGVADTFDYDFKISAQTDLKVTTTDLNGVDTVLTLTANYTVTGVGNDGGGSITLTAGALTSGHLIVIEDNVPTEQAVPFGNQSSFSGSLHETAFDKVTRIARKVIGLYDFAIRIPTSLQGVDVELPKPVGETVLGWNAAGTALENQVVPTGGIVTDGSITASKLAAGAVETAKILDSNVTTAKINDGAVTNAKRTYETTVSGYIRAGNTQIWDGDATGLAYDLTAETVDTWLTVGPTGSGSTIILPSLDDMPSSTRILILTANIYGQNLAVGEVNTTLSFAAGGVAATILNNRRAGITDWCEDIADSYGATIPGILVPLSSTQTFQIYIEYSNTVFTSGALDIITEGFICG